MREAAYSEPSNYEHLEELEWAIGEWVEFEGRRFTVAGMERNRIALVRIEKIGTEIVESEEAASDGVDVKGAPQIARH